MIVLPAVLASREQRGGWFNDVTQGARRIPSPFCWLADGVSPLASDEVGQNTMPSHCCVFGCANHSIKDKKHGLERSYFKILKMKTNQGEKMREITATRRREWIAESDINRRALTRDVRFSETVRFSENLSEEFKDMMF